MEALVYGPDWEGTNPRSSLHAAACLTRSQCMEEPKLKKTWQRRRPYSMQGNAWAGHDWTRARRSTQAYNCLSETRLVRRRKYRSLPCRLTLVCFFPWRILPACLRPPALCLSPAQYSLSPLSDRRRSTGTDGDPLQCCLRFMDMHGMDRICHHYCCHKTTYVELLISQLLYVVTTGERERGGRGSRCQLNGEVNVYRRSIDEGVRILQAYESVSMPT
jgi:hypothetical protein